MNSVDKDGAAEIRVPILGFVPSFWQRRRAQKEAASLARRVDRALERNPIGGPGAREAVADIVHHITAVREALARDDHDAICVGMVKLEHLADRHLTFTRKSTIREYVDSIGAAVLIALVLRAFVVEAFKIPSGSMIPTMEVGDHIFVNKFIYGLRIPFTKIKFFELRKPHRGEVIVFIYPREPDKDFIKRIVAVEGDSVEVRNDRLIVNGRQIPRKELGGATPYLDYDENLEGKDGENPWTEKTALRVEEELDGERYVTLHNVHAAGTHDFPPPGEPPYVVPKNSVFVLGDNRDNSHDSRFWGPVPLENIKGKALVVWWSSGRDGPRWGRLGHVVE